MQVPDMKFCEKCNSYMRETRDGFRCTRCGYVIETSILEIKNMDRQKTSPIEVIESSDGEAVKINMACPKCGNLEAFHSTSFSSGEHAGVRQERSIERFKCAKCAYSWNVS
jgi:DNA-directed RNA polymerase subunit M/transcription elongation factor TFIIS